MSERCPVKLRNLRSNDIPFIFSTWLKSYRQSSWAKEMSNDVFFSYHKVVIADILAKDTTEVNIICGLTEETEDEIYGYIIAEKVAEKYLLHFVYCKYNFRKLGIVKTALEELGYLSTDGAVNFITHLPRGFQTLKTKFNLEYCPYLLNN